MAEPLDPSGRIALVTGANKGIGFEIARQLAAKGATVLVGARREEAGVQAAAAIRAEGGMAEPVRLDISDAGSIAAAVSGIEAQFGRLDILVNNAGVSIERGKQPSEADIGMLRETFETNVFGTVAVTNAMLPLLQKSDAGRIVNMSTGLASFALTAGPAAPFSAMRLLAYNSSKAALNSATITLANELDGSPVKINLANPGLCATDLSMGRGQPASEGAAVAVELALVGPEGPNGAFIGATGNVPW